METCPQCGRDAVTDGVCGFCGWGKTGNTLSQRMVIQAARWGEKPETFTAQAAIDFVMQCGEELETVKQFAARQINKL